MKKLNNFLYKSYSEPYLVVKLVHLKKHFINYHIYNKYVKHSYMKCLLTKSW